MKHLVFLILVQLALALPFGATLRAQDLEAVSAGVTADLQKALADLTAARKEVEEERLPLSRKLNELEQKLIDRKAEYAKAERFQGNQLVELGALKKQAKDRSDEVKTLDALLNEYARTFRSRLNFVEEPRFASVFDAVDKAAVAPDLSPAHRFAQRSAILTTSLKRTEGALGGELFEGRALDKQGRVQQGKVALIGPVAMFADNSGQTAGLLQQELNKTDPTVADTDKAIVDSSRALILNGKGDIALDPTGGNAFKLSALEESLYEKIAAGGWVMAPLIAIGFAAILVAFFKWLQLSRIRLATEKDLQTVLRHLENRQQEKAIAHARGIRGIAGDLLATAVEHVDEKKEYIEEVLYEKMLAARTRLERGLAFLALTATVGPLMGLLGTVMGMIATFKLISSFGSGDPKVLAAGISEALIATASGMTVAIPALLLHAFLSRKAKSIIGSMEQTAVGFINGVPNEEKSFEEKTFA
ncbi:MAG TPA: MotA/TolQ/ExbB proton channel family protein [Methylomirabilota bacterium]|nr:MotA/TolQ/ExbB proton channel family protein [Methylomirabilota bacterium]